MTAAEDRVNVRVLNSELSTVFEKVPRESLLHHSGYFRDHHNFLTASNSDCSIYKVEPPCPGVFLYSLQSCVQQELPSVVLRGELRLQNLRNADYLDIKVLRDLCYENFAKDWRLVIGNQHFCHTTLPWEHIPRFIQYIKESDEAATNPLTAKDILSILIAWARGLRVSDDEAEPVQSYVEDHIDPVSDGTLTLNFLTEMMLMDGFNAVVPAAWALTAALRRKQCVSCQKVIPEYVATMRDCASGRGKLHDIGLPIPPRPVRAGWINGRYRYQKHPDPDPWQA